MLDVVLSGGTICNGTGHAPFVTDIALQDDRIARIGDCRDMDSALRLECSGLCVAPGFIDMHGHSDEVLLVLPTADSKIRQGITTEVGGNCGFSPAPLLGSALEEKRALLVRRYDLEPSWRDFGGFFAALEAAQPALNFCCLAGLGTIRTAIEANAPPPLHGENLERASVLVREACEQGAIGVSSGLIYTPGSFADTNELVALAASAAASGSSLYASHVRSESDRLVEAVDEALEVGARAECAVQLSHHKASRKQNWGKVHDTLAHVERARQSGLDVIVDQYPYKASSTGLDVILPEDVRIGSPEEIASRLADARYASLVAARVELDYGGRWGDVFVSTVGSQRNRSLEGMSILEVARATGRTPVAAALRLLVDERLDVSAIYFTMCEDDVRTVLSYQYTSIGTDAVVRATSGITSEGKPHPRAYGTFPRIFKRYVRDVGLLSLAEATRRATSLAALRLGLRNRGVLAEGNFADIVVFDPRSIADTSTYLEPHQYPLGVTHVFVNGKGALLDGTLTGERSGRVLRRGRDL